MGRDLRPGAYAVLMTYSFAGIFGLAHLASENPSHELAFQILVATAMLGSIILALAVLLTTE